MFLSFEEQKEKKIAEVQENLKAVTAHLFDLNDLIELQKSKMFPDVEKIIQMHSRMEELKKTAELLLEYQKILKKTN